MAFVVMATFGLGSLSFVIDTPKRRRGPLLTSVMMIMNWLGKEDLTEILSKLIPSAVMVERIFVDVVIPSTCSRSTMCGETAFVVTMAVEVTPLK